MEQIKILTFTAFLLACLIQSPPVKAGETLLSTILTPDVTEKNLNRQGRSYYDDRYERLEYGPSRCGRCDDRYDDRDDYRDRYDDDDRPSRDRYGDDRDRDRYDDDRRSHRPTYGNRHDKNDDNISYDSDRKMNSNQNSNGTDEEGDKKRPHDDREKPRRRGGDRHRNRYDDRDRYRPDYRDPYRDYERPYYDDPYYRDRRPLYDRYDDGYPSRYDGYRRPVYDDRYDRAYYDSYGGYGPSVGRGPHDRPWDETYRGQAGWDAGGRGYYFASGRPDPGAAPAYGRQDYRPSTYNGWQNVGYASDYSGGGAYGGGAAYGGGRGTAYGSSGYQDPTAYRGSFGYQDSGYRQDLSTAYGRPSGWLSVGERRPYRDQSGVSQLDNRDNHIQPSRNTQNNYGQDSQSQTQNSQPFGQSNRIQPGLKGYSQSSTTPVTSYLYQRGDEQVTLKTVDGTSSQPPS